MTTHARHAMGAQSGYEPPAVDRRAPEPDNDEPKVAWWRRWSKPSELVMAVAAVAAVLGYLGFQVLTPDRALKAETAVRAKTDTVLTLRIDSLARSYTSLTDRLLFTNFLLCEQIRSNPSPSIAAKAREDCDDIVKARLAP